ncbi:DEAD/DEAH box helicase [Ferdinandcohnia quinoae]|uniref:ATP-dependent RNA helicase DbpA n=1 Tax=Fredinandcohnia quinoae TaxID=2918902 RepID=A0AAW5DUM0_9BACI|nr:DEAD/DEAH box helicase [Fredinandcohnia sp. SECRCQ15]MCH1624332.1 DEAD/DEAH box helicase [Fredinandcohnia sp. SECRCQ15]
MRFNDYPLSENILKALEGLNYDEPTEVQSEVIPITFKGRDLVVKSQTGSGKTAAFAIPLCELINWEENKPQALVLTPTRELAAQVKEDITNIGRFKRIKATAIYGKQSFERQKVELKQKNHVVVGTPGRVLDHIEKETLSLEKVKYLVIDEADEMLNMGFIEQVEAIIQSLPTERMTMLFSATLPEDIEQLSKTYMKTPTHIVIEGTGLLTNSIDHSFLDVEEEAKFPLLTDIATVENPDSCIIFCRTQVRVDQLLERMEKLNFSCDKIHGGMIQEDRFAVMDDFKRGKFRYLVATDVAARGIDVENISLVINYDLPLEKESYVHRIGRTGRAGEMGKAITFVTNQELKYVADIESFIGCEIRKGTVPTIEEVAQGAVVFTRSQIALPKLKKDKSEQLNKDIMKLYFNGGKKKKLRAVDFVGTIAKLRGVSADDIGIITIQENVTYVDILNGKGSLVLQAMKNTTIKGKLLKVHIAKK